MVLPSPGGNAHWPTSVMKSSVSSSTVNFLHPAPSRGTGCTSSAGGGVTPDQTLIIDLSRVAPANAAAAAMSTPFKPGRNEPKHGRYRDGANTNASTSTAAQIVRIRSSPAYFLLIPRSTGPILVQH